ncbi:MAG: hypothetical protein NT138_21010 [Planctomycetales bacterium]|jgi:hypothetical protein|nr:hypothetical protein [Planctomycetales bacterium]
MVSESGKWWLGPFIDTERSKAKNQYEETHVATLYFGRSRNDPARGTSLAYSPTLKRGVTCCRRIRGESPRSMPSEHPPEAMH